MPPAKKTSTADAAAILRVHEDEVTGVAGKVATTFDGQRYELTGERPGDYVWLRADGQAVPAAPADDSEAAGE